MEVDRPWVRARVRVRVRVRVKGRATGIEVDENGAGDIASCTCLTVVHVDAVELQIRSHKSINVIKKKEIREKKLIFKKVEKKSRTKGNQGIK